VQTSRTLTREPAGSERKFEIWYLGLVINLRGSTPETVHPLMVRSVMGRKAGVNSFEVGVYCSCQAWPPSVVVQISGVEVVTVPCCGSENSTLTTSPVSTASVEEGRTRVQ
jgi:hypothetical protein